MYKYIWTAEGSSQCEKSYQAHHKPSIIRTERAVIIRIKIVIIRIQMNQNLVIKVGTLGKNLEHKECVKFHE